MRAASRRASVGRPKGSKDKKTLVAEEFEKDGSKLARVILDKALQR